MADYGMLIRNADGVPVLDTRRRCMEAVAWGTVTAPNRGGLEIAIPSGVIAPTLFMRPNEVGVIVRGRLSPTGSSVWISADRNMSVSYVIGGFRVGGDTGGGYGAAIWDADGNLCFSSSRPYIRFPYRSLTLSNTFMNPSTTAQYIITSGGGYTHPDWTANTYMYWSPLPVWDHTSSVDWFLGMWFGSIGGVAKYIETLRVDINQWRWDPPYNLGGQFSGPPGTNIGPQVLLTCEFTPPT